MIVASLVVLAVVASLFLVFSDSVQVLRIGLMAALWAAVIGAIAMTKYRRESAAGQAKIRDLQTVYELQLEREVSARREYEAGVETRVRGELSVEASELAALRAELAALRGSLEILFDGRMPPERVAIDAEAVRVGELGPATVRPPATFAPKPTYATPAAGSMFATPFDEPVTAEVSVVEDDEVAPPPAATGRIAADVRIAAEPDLVTDVEMTTEIDMTTTRGADTSIGVGPAQESSPHLPFEADEPNPATEAAPPAPTAPAPRRNRRRAESESEDSVDSSGSHSSGLTVAEILANVQAGATSAGGTRSGRRRRE